MEEYSLKFILLSNYVPSFDSMSRFFTGVFVLLMEEYSTTMLHDKMILSRLIVYAQSIKKSMIV